MNRLQDMDCKGKNVFLRVDFNVPMKQGKITDDYRIENALPTIKKILAQKPKQLVIGTHLGRPKPGSASLQELSLGPVAQRLSSLLNKTVYLHANPLAPIESYAKIVLLENLRFYEEEKKGSQWFAKQLAQHADMYVNDAFGTAHRKDTSVYALAKLLPHYAGLLLENEIEHVHLQHERPTVALFGAAKIADKLPLFKKLLAKVDLLILGGGVVFTFLKAGGVEVGKSLVEESMVKEAEQLLKRYSKKIIFPVDFQAMAPSKLKHFDDLKVAERKELISIVAVDKIPKSKACYDVGPESIKLFNGVLQGAKTVIWNGPLGMFEVKPFNKSTNEIAKLLAGLDATTIICGGDTASAVRTTKYASSMSHISTGGGASLELLAGKKLPAISVLEK